MKNLQKKVIELLKTNGWGQEMNLYLKSLEFRTILSHLYMDSEEGNHFIPKLSEVFKPFLECSFEDVKVIIINDNPSSQVNNNNGLAFWDRLDYGQYSKFIKECGAETEEVPERMKQFTRQGVLLINFPMTINDNKVHHQKLWKPFIEYVLGILRDKKEHIVIVTLGEATELFDHDLTCESISLLRDWNSNKLFERINNKLKKMGESPIIWSSKKLQ